MSNKFSRFQQPKPCANCGKLTTSPGQGTDLCTKCYNLAGIENEHEDGHHSDEPHKDCPACKEAEQAAKEAIKRST